MMNHLYVDTTTGAVGYRGDLVVDEHGGYTDKGLPVVEGDVRHLRYAMIGGHELGWLERLSPEARLQVIGRWPTRRLHDRPTALLHPRAKEEAA